MTVSQSPVVLLSVLLVGCTRSIERTEPKPLYPVPGAVVDSINGLPLPHARVGLAHGGSRTCRLPSDQRVPVGSVGVFTLLLPAGRYRICAEALGFIARAALVERAGAAVRSCAVCPRRPRATASVCPALCVRLRDYPCPRSSPVPLKEGGSCRHRLVRCLLLGGAPEGNLDLGHRRRS